MKKILSFISLLLALSFFTISPLYAAAHEKKTADTASEVATDSNTTEATSDVVTDSDAADTEKNKPAEEDEEPDCD